MARKAYAARKLLQQVGGEVVGDPDGLSVHRTVMVSQRYADALARDDRVEQVVVVHTELGDVALVEFVDSTRADRTHPFEL